MSSPRERQLRSCDRAFGKHGLAEPKQLGGPPQCIGRHRAGFLDKVLLLDQTTEIRLMQSLAGERLRRCVAIAAT